MPTRIRRSLVETPHGQIHVRAIGAGQPVVLLHWTPGSGRQYLHVMPELAARGYRVLAPDHMGFGMSDPRPTAWAVGDFADNVADIMASLGVPSAHIVGGHFSSEVAVELALRHPTRVTSLTLDGSPVWSADMRAKVLANARPQSPPWSEDGAHIAWIWQRAMWLRKMWDPSFALNAATAETLATAVLENLLAGDTADTADALKNYDLDLALPRLGVGTLALTAETDPLTGCHTDVLRLVPGARGHAFKGAHPLHHASRASDYARVLHAFFSGTAPELFHDAKTPTQAAGASYGVHSG
jgi:pimeloyl-ACP methyl ester carboxylesterase